MEPNLAGRDQKEVSISEEMHQRMQKRIARIMVADAIRTGKLVRLPCETCGALKSEAHHDDYSKPLDVLWLCRSHHRARHGSFRQSTKAIKEAPESTDPAVPTAPCGRCKILNAGVVLDSRANVVTNEIRRRRCCTICGRRWTTYEIESNHIPSGESDGLLRYYRRTLQKILSIVPPETIAKIEDIETGHVLDDARQWMWR